MDELEESRQINHKYSSRRFTDAEIECIAATVEGEQHSHVFSGEGWYDQLMPCCAEFWR